MHGFNLLDNHFMMDFTLSDKTQSDYLAAQQTLEPPALLLLSKIFRINTLTPLYLCQPLRNGIGE